jgi:hypothetical protein
MLSLVKGEMRRFLAVEFPDGGRFSPCRRGSPGPDGKEKSGGAIGNTSCLLLLRLNVRQTASRRVGPNDDRRHSVVVGSAGAWLRPEVIPDFRE